MATCDFCGEQYSPRYECNYCEQHHCAECRLPEQHNCPLFVIGESERLFESDAPSTLGERASEQTESRDESSDVEDPEPMDLSDHKSPSSKEPPTASSPTVSTISNDVEAADEMISNADEARGGSILSKIVVAFSAVGSLLATTVGWVLRPIYSVVTNPIVVLLAVIGLFFFAGTVGTGVVPLDNGAETALEGVASLAALGGGGSPAGGGDDAGDSSESNSGGALADSLNETAIELAVHERVNQMRQQRGLQPLNHDQRLQTIANGHSEDMAKRGYFAHDAPDGSDFSDRYDTANYDCRVSIDASQYASGAENIAYTFADADVMTDSGETVDHNGNETKIGYGIVRQWMNSQGHRENILQDYWRNEGVGVAVANVDGRQKIYVTQNFC